MLKNKVFIVTGANGRIGLELSKNLIKLGAKVVMTDIEVNKIKTLSLSNNYLVKKINITNEVNIKNLISSTHKKYKKIDGIIHCAYPVTKDWGQLIEKLKSKSLKENLFNQLGISIIISKLIISYFMKNKIQGKIIFFSSIQGVRAPKFEHYKGLKMSSPVEYSVMKAGLISLTSYLAKLYKKYKISINCISPGGIKDKQPKKFMKRYLESCGTKGLLDPKDVVGTIIFLLSNDSEFINGQNIIIDDGWSL